MTEIRVATPEEAAELNAQSSSNAQPTGGRVATPDELQQLQSAPGTPPPVRSLADTAAGYGKAISGGVAEGGARTWGAPIDLYNLIGDVTAGRGMAWLLDKFGASGAADWLRQNGYKDIYTGSGQSIVDATKALTDPNHTGINYQPQTQGEAEARKLAAGTTQGIGTAMLAAPLAGAADLAPTVGTGGISGAGSVVGGEAGRAANDWSRSHLGISLTDPAAETIGGLLGGFAAPAGTSLLSREATPMQTALEDKGVPVRFPGQVDPDKGLGLAATSWGGQGRTATNLSGLHTALGDYARRFLHAPEDLDFEGLGQTTQKLGQNIQDSAEGAVTLLRQDISDAFDKVSEVVPDSTPVQLDNTQAAINHVASRSTDPDVQAALKKAATDDPVLGVLLQKQQLTWGDVNDVRTRIGQLIQSADGQTLGALKLVYGGLMDDMRTAAQAADPNGLALFERANQLAAENNDKIRGVLDTLASRESPETLPAYMLGQSKTGATRLESLMNTPMFPPNESADTLFNTPYTWSSDRQFGAADPRFGPARSGVTLGATPTGRTQGDQIQVKLTNAQGDPVSLLNGQDYPMGRQLGGPGGLLQQITDRINNLNGLHYVDPEGLQRTPPVAGDQGIFQTPEGNWEQSTAQGELGRQLLVNAARGQGGNFDLDQLMKFWQNASPEARDALTRTPYIADNMGELAQMYEGYQRSKGQASAPGTSVFDPAVAVPASVGFGTGLYHALQGGDLKTAGALLAGGIAGPAIGGNLMARAAQTPTGVRLQTGTPTIPMNLPANAAGTGLGISMFPDIYQPKYENEQQVVPKDVVSFLSNGDPKAITAYVGAKLGQQVAAQLPAGDSPGFKGAIFNLMAQPQYRKQLIGSPAGQ